MAGRGVLCKGVWAKVGLGRPTWRAEITIDDCDWKSIAADVYLRNFSVWIVLMVLHLQTRLGLRSTAYRGGGGDYFAGCQEAL